MRPNGGWPGRLCVLVSNRPEEFIGGLTGLLSRRAGTRSPRRLATRKGFLLVGAVPGSEKPAPNPVEVATRPGKHSPSLAKHSTSLVDYSASLVKHTTSPVEYSASLVKHSARLVAHSARLVEYSASLDEYSARPFVVQKRHWNRTSCQGLRKNAGVSSKSATKRRLVPPRV